MASAAPVDLSAQDESETVGQVELTVFARAHVAIGEARDAFHAAIAAAHEEQAIERAREAFEERVAEILEEHALTEERYGQVLHVVSMDPNVRARLDAILEGMSAESGDPGGG